MCHYFAVITMALIIATSPVLAGLAPACVKTGCDCAAMNETHGTHPASGLKNRHCDCRTAENAPCGMTPNRIPDYPDGLLTLDRTGFSFPLANGYPPLSVIIGAPGSSRGSRHAPPFDVHAPPPVYLLTQCFLI